MNELIRQLLGWKSAAAKASEGLNTKEDIKRGQESHARKVEEARKRAAQRAEARKKKPPKQPQKPPKKPEKEESPKKSWYQKNIYDLW